MAVEARAANKLIDLLEFTITVKRPAKPSLTGTWVASAGARFRVANDGQVLKVSLVDGGGNLALFAGELRRR